MKTFRRFFQADDGVGTSGTATTETAVTNETTESTIEVQTEEVNKEQNEPKGESESTVASDNTVSTEEYNKLKAELDKLQTAVKDKTTLEETTKNLQKEIDQLKNTKATAELKATEYEAVLNELVETKLKSVPENIKELVPTNLSVKEQLNWLNKAETNGLFGQATAPNVEIGKPMNPSKPKQHIDYNTMSPATMMASAYGLNKK